MNRELTTVAFLTTQLFLAGCAFDVVRLKQVATTLDTRSPCNDTFVLADDVDLQLSGGYSRRLKKGTRWTCIGKTPQGRVFQTQDQVLTAEASNVFEARLVVIAERVVGLYLPVERTFSPLDDHPKLVIRSSRTLQPSN